MEGWAKVKLAARYAGVCERTMRDWIKVGLKHSRIPSGTLLIKFEDIDTFLEGFSVNDNRVNEIVKEVEADLGI